MAGDWRKRSAAVRNERDGGLFSLLVLGACFCLGILSGLLFASLGPASPELSDYLEDYFRHLGSEGSWRPAPWSVLWELMRWHGAALVFGFTALGAFCVPALLVIRGFLLTYSISLFVRLFGGRGMLAALAAFGVTALLALPALLAVSCDAFRSSLSRLDGGGGGGVICLHQKLGLLLSAAVVLVVAAVVQWSVMPALLSTVCARLFVS